MSCLERKLGTSLTMILVMGIAMAGIITSAVIPTYGEQAMPEKISDISSPLKQFKSGVALQNIQCKAGLELIVKATDESPACVKQSTAARLILSGWAKPLESMQDTEQSENKIITLADNGKSIDLRNGQSFLLKLGDSYDWNVEIDNQTVLSRVMNVMVVRGAQGIYEAHSPGTATLSAVGDPFCYTAVPRCMMPSIGFQINVIVTP